MRDDGASFLEIFQDPLLTIVALIQLNTTWVVIPDRVDYEDIKSSMKTDEKRPLREDVKSIEGKVALLKSEIMRKQHELEWLKEKINELHALSTGSSEDASQIKQKIEELEKELARKKEELKQIEDALKKRKEDLSTIRGIDNVEEIYEKIAALERELEVKHEELHSLDKQIEIARQNAVDANVRADEQRKLIAPLQVQLKALLEEIKRLENEIAGIGSAGGFKPVFESDKEDYYIELVNNCLFPVDDDHYVNEDNRRTYGGITYITKNGKKTRKASVSGENINKIGNPESNFNKTLNKLDPKKQRIIFLLHGDSIEIFRQAKAIALEKGIEIGWWAYEKDSILWWFFR